MNDRLTAIPNSRTLWHDLLDWFPELVDQTSEPYAMLASRVEEQRPWPDYVIRNSSYFRRLQIPVPTAVFVQDRPAAAEMQLDVCDMATVVVFNSEFTRAAFPELASHPDLRVIPIGVDFDRFRPRDDSAVLRAKWGILPESVLFVGSSDEVKGYDLLTDLIATTEFNFCLVMKDDAEVRHPRVRSFTRLSGDEIAEVMAACAVGICTSRSETQHLAGIEMGAAGLPLVTTSVGAYAGRNAGDWGMTTSVSDFPLALQHVMTRRVTFDPRGYWIEEGMDLGTCRGRWAKVVECLTA